MHSSTERIQLLSKTEINELYARPNFNSQERMLYFSLNEIEREALQTFRNTQTRIHFILNSGYFKAKHQFFNVSLEDAQKDVEYIVSTYYSNTDTQSFTGQLSRKYIRKQRQAILSLFNYQDWSPEYTNDIASHIAYLLRYFPKTHNAFRQIYPSDFKRLVGDKTTKPHELSALSDWGEWVPSTPQHLERRRVYWSILTENNGSFRLIVFFKICLVMLFQLSQRDSIQF